MSGKGAVCKVRSVGGAGKAFEAQRDHLLLLSNKLSRQLVGKKLDTRSEVSLHLESRLDNRFASRRYAGCLHCYVRWCICACLCTSNIIQE
jgi:hypothetical protein